MDTKEAYLNDYDALRRLNNKYQDMTFAGEPVWLYFKNKINGFVHAKYRDSIKMKYNAPIRETLHYQVDQLSELLKNGENSNLFGKLKTVDAVFFEDFRPKKENNRVVSSTFDGLYKQLNEQGKTFIRLITRPSETQYAHEVANNVYSTYEAKFIDADLIINNISSEEFQVLSDLQTEVNDLFGNADIFDKFIPEISQYAAQHSYYRQAYKLLKPKVVFTFEGLSSHPQYQAAIISAKQVGIPVYDVQTSIISHGHNGYDFNAGFHWAPEGLIASGAYWNLPEIFGKEVDFHVIGDSQHRVLIDDSVPNSKMVYFVSQSLIDKFVLKQATLFAESFPEFTVVVKEHPNSLYFTDDIKESLPGNITVIKKDTNDELFNKAGVIIGAGSTKLLEAIQRGKKVVILDESYLSFTMDQFTSKNNVFHTHNLVKDFSSIIKVNDVAETPHLYDEVQNLLFDTLIQYKGRYKYQNTDVVSIADLRKHNKKQKNLRQLSYKKRLIEYGEGHDQPILTVGIPTYNGAGTIEFLVNTLAENYVFPYTEVIIVNDGSKDDTANVAKKLTEQYANVRVITNNPASGGAMQPRKQAIQAANGEYILLFDADDYFWSNKLDKILADMIYKNADIAKMSLYVKRNDQMLRWALKNKKYSKKEWLNGDDFIWNIMMTHNHIVKSDIYKAIEAQYDYGNVTDDALLIQLVYNIGEWNTLLTYGDSINVWDNDTDGLSSNVKVSDLTAILGNLTRLWTMLETNQGYTHYRHFADLIVYKNMLMTNVKSMFEQGEEIPEEAWQSLISLIDKVNVFLTPENRFASVTKETLKTRMLGKLGRIRFSKEKLMFEIDNVNAHVEFSLDNKVLTQKLIHIPAFAGDSISVGVKTDVNMEPFSDLYSVGEYKFVVKYTGRFLQFETQHKSEMGSLPINIAVTNESSIPVVSGVNDTIGLHFQFENRQLYLTSSTKLAQLFNKDNKEILINDDTIEGQILDSARVQTRAGYTINPQSFVYSVGLYKYVIEVNSKGIRTEKYSISEDKAVFNVSQISEDRIRLAYTSDVYDFKQASYYVNGVDIITAPIQDVEVDLLDELFISNNADGTHRNALHIENNVNNFVYDEATRVLRRIKHLN